MFTENIILHIMRIISKKLEFFYVEKGSLDIYFKKYSFALKKILFNFQRWIERSTKVGRIKEVTKRDYYVSSDSCEITFRNGAQAQERK